ncbi:MAG: molecular chaperone DnaJ [Candidatus Micrarchaeaceae archaeon]|jgi:molecular chaperone DnaJ
MAKDYYEVLGIGKKASTDEIKNAYRGLALRYHPDKNKEKGSEEKFKEINEAYAVLSDPEKRKQYDSFGPEGFSQHYTTEDIFRNVDFESVFRNMGFDMGNFGGDDFFESMFGFNPRGNVGNDILARVQISLQEAAHGSTQSLSIRHIKVCDRCKGNGAEPGTKIVKCDMCNGTGQMRNTQRTPFGVIQTIGTCTKCRGSGRSFEKACKKCNGSGAMHAEDKVEVTIPKGIATGTRLRLQGMGDYGNGEPGDLYIDVEVKEDRTFKRVGDDIYTELHVPLHVALLGGEASAHTIKGDKKISIEEGTQNSSKITLKGEGMPHFRGSGHGDEIVNIIVDIPKKLTNEQKELVRKLANLNPDDDKKKRFGIF